MSQLQSPFFVGLARSVMELHLHVQALSLSVLLHNHLDIA